MLNVSYVDFLDMNGDCHVILTVKGKLRNTEGKEFILRHLTYVLEICGNFSYKWRNGNKELQLYVRLEVHLSILLTNNFFIIIICGMGFTFFNLKILHDLFHFAVSK